MGWECKVIKGFQRLASTFVLSIEKTCFEALALNEI